MTKLFVFWAIASAIALYQLIRHMTGSKNYRRFLTLPLFIPVVIYSFFCGFSSNPYRMGPGPELNAAYEKEENGYYFFSGDEDMVIPVDDVYVSKEITQHRKVYIGTNENGQGTKYVQIDGKEFRLLDNAYGVSPDYTDEYNFIYYASITTIAVSFVLMTIKDIIDLNKKGVVSPDENEEKEKS